MSWMMTQTWNELLFAHWPVKPEWIQPLLPDGLSLDTYEGMAWVGVVPFHMTDIRLRGMPPIPFTTAFPELNVRTYVKCGGKSGVYFFSLDAAHRPAVWAARTWFHLPYYNANITVGHADRQTIQYESRRTDPRGGVAEFQAEYRPTTPIYHSEAGTLEHWLSERYCLFTTHRNGVLLRGDIQHEPWPLQRAEAHIQTNTMNASLPFTLHGEPLHVHYAHVLKVYLWRLIEVWPTKR